jgi:uncharacterized protein
MGPGKAHLPYQAAIDAYGNGGFRFADMSHRGSLLSLPSGIWGWVVGETGEIDEVSLQPVLAEARDIDILVLGSGDAPRPLPELLRWRLRELGIGLELTSTGPAVRTYNILLAERRRVAAGLIAVG